MRSAGYLGRLFACCCPRWVTQRPLRHGISILGLYNFKRANDTAALPPGKVSCVRLFSPLLTLNLILRAGHSSPNNSHHVSVGNGNCAYIHHLYQHVILITTGKTLMRSHSCCRYASSLLLRPCFSPWWTSCRWLLVNQHSQLQGLSFVKM